MDARSGDVLSLTDWYNDATYTVFPFGYNDPRDGDREVISDPWDPVASPNGWHVVDPEMGVPEITTAGYNVFAQDNSRGNRSADDFRRPVVGKDLAFDFELDLENEPEDYWNASTVNLFYWNNIVTCYSSFFFFFFCSSQLVVNFNISNSPLDPRPLLPLRFY